jgi:hypothetical protein
MPAQFIFTMRDLRRFYPPDREVLRGINLSFYPGAKIGVIGANGSGKSSLLRIMAGLDDGFTGEARLTPGFTVGFLAQEPQLDPTKDVAGNVTDGVAEIKGSWSASTRCAAMGEPDADFDKLLAEQSDLQDRIDAAGAWDLDRTWRSPWTRCGSLPATPTSPPCRAASAAGWRCAGCCCPSPTCCCSTSRPTISTPSRWPGWSGPCRTIPGTVVAVTHDRYFLDNVAGWILELDRGPASRGRATTRRGWSRSRPAWPGGEGRPGPAAHPGARAGVDPDVAPGPPGQGQGPHHRLQRTGGRGRGRRAAGRQARDHHPPRAPRWATGWSSLPRPRQGLRRPAADRRACPSSCRPAASWASSAPTGRARPRCSA